jgi:hypothetical protein
MMNPEITVCVTTAPISSLPLPSRSDCGAVLDFFGVVRGEEKGEQIAGLEYEAYQPMAERQIEQIIRALLDQFPCRAVDVVHRIGFIAVGESSIVVRVASPRTMIRQDSIARQLTATRCVALMRTDPCESSARSRLVSVNCHRSVTANALAFSPARGFQPAQITLPCRKS